MNFSFCLWGGVIGKYPGKIPTTCIIFNAPPLQMATDGNTDVKYAKKTEETVVPQTEEERAAESWLN